MLWTPVVHTNERRSQVHPAESGHSLLKLTLNTNVRGSNRDEIVTKYQFNQKVIENIILSLKGKVFGTA